MKDCIRKIPFLFLLVSFFSLLYVIVDAETKVDINYGYWELKETNKSDFLILKLDEKKTNPNMIYFCRVDFGEGKICLLEIPNETLVEINGQSKQLRNLYQRKNGINLLKSEVKKLIGIYPSNYIAVSDEDLEYIFNAVGHNSSPKSKTNEYFLDFYSDVLKKFTSFDGMIQISKNIDTFKKHIKSDFKFQDFIGNISDLRKIKTNSIKIYRLPGNYEYRDKNNVFTVDYNKLNKLINIYFN